MHTQAGARAICELDNTSPRPTAAPEPPDAPDTASDDAETSMNESGLLTAVENGGPEIESEDFAATRFFNE